MPNSIGTRNTQSISEKFFRKLLAMLISAKDRERIRDLAKKQLELASRPEMDSLRREWRRNNDCVAGGPMVTVEWGTFRKEIITPRLQTKTEKRTEVRFLFYGFQCGF